MTPNRLLRKNRRIQCISSESLHCSNCLFLTWVRARSCWLRILRLRFLHSILRALSGISQGRCSMTQPRTRPLTLGSRLSCALTILPHLRHVLASERVPGRLTHQHHHQRQAGHWYRPFLILPGPRSHLRTSLDAVLSTSEPSSSRSWRRTRSCVVRRDS